MKRHDKLVNFVTKSLKEKGYRIEWLSKAPSLVLAKKKEEKLLILLKTGPLHKGTIERVTSILFNRAIIYGDDDFKNASKYIIARVLPSNITLPDWKLVHYFEVEEFLSGV